MTGEDFRYLAVLSVRDPAQAARGVLAAAPFPTRFLWGALALMAVLNALLFGVTMVLTPPPAGAPTIFLPSPIGYLVIVGLGLIGMVLSVFQVGRWLGGTATLTEVLTLITWLQVLRLIVQVAAVVLSIASSLLALMLSVAASVLGLWIALHFINEAHRLGSLGRAAVVMVAAGIATLFLVSVLITLIAAPFIGIPNNV